MRGVRAVVAADDKEHIHVRFEHFKEGILTLLCGSANGVEELEVFYVAVALSDRAVDAFLNFFSFTFEHGGLVCYTYSFEVCLGVETVRNCVTESLHEFFGRFFAEEIVAEKVGVFERKDYDIVAVLFVAKSSGSSGAGFFVSRFAVNDGSKAVFGIATHSTPNFHDITAGRIDDCRASLFDFFDVAGWRAEGWYDDDIVFGELIVLLVHFFPRERNDVHFIELTIDFLVMNDFTDEVDVVFLEDVSRGVGEIDGTLYSVAEAKLAGEFHGSIANGE